jgi:hypothetical protein
MVEELLNSGGKGFQQWGKWRKVANSGVSAMKKKM